MATGWIPHLACLTGEPLAHSICWPGVIAWRQHEQVAGYLAVIVIWSSNLSSRVSASGEDKVIPPGRNVQWVDVEFCPGGIGQPRRGLAQTGSTPHRRLWRYSRTACARSYPSNLST